ncbi:MAG: cellulase family glycosylhydrolase [Cryobacterium sp.]|nr:cellulase family glycosylhydrolase [Oligoflexia bacterium]
MIGQQFTKRLLGRTLLRCVLLVAFTFTASAIAGSWSPKQAAEWYEAQPWLVGSNFLPSDAENALEMWQAETFNAKEIDRELAWAETLGMTTMRVFLHDLAFKKDPRGFLSRVDAFLAIAARHHIKPMLVFFDSCWDPEPKVGKQLPPRIGVHNSRWVQSPGLPALADLNQHARLRKYVKAVVRAFGSDPRVLAWDVWNEPDNLNNGSYNDPRWKLEAVRTLLPQVFSWARSEHPTQPLTSAVWNGDWSSAGRLNPIERIQLSESDIVTFHNYGKTSDFSQKLAWLKRLHLPVICTEYMARPLGSTFQKILPIAKNERVGMMNWGFVAGKSQTYIPWDSWQKPYPPEGPKVWFHDIFYPNGKPYRVDETDFIRSMTGPKFR